MFLGGLVSGVAVHELQKYFDDHDRVTIKVTSNDAIVHKFGFVQVWKADDTRVEQRHFRDEKDPTITVHVAAGVYRVSVLALTNPLFNREREFDRGTTAEYSDKDLLHPEFFPDQDFLEIHEGEFTQGSDDIPNARPAHRVSLSAFRIRRAPVTACEFAGYLAAEGQLRSGDIADDVKTCLGPDAKKPAAWVTWDDACGFCKWLSRFKGRKFRLPTESEYERAMRIAYPKSRYPWGNSEYDPDKPPAPRVAMANYKEYWNGRTTWDRTDVGTFPSVNGLRDIAGNVWEWTSDWFDPEFYGSKEWRSRNPQGPTKSPTGKRSIRGGSCQDPIEMLSCAYRTGIDPAYANYNVGFRVVMDLQ